MTYYTFPKVDSSQSFADEAPICNPLMLSLNFAHNALICQPLKLFVRLI